jgi:hypothetical protein
VGRQFYKTAVETAFMADLLSEALVSENQLLVADLCDQAEALAHRSGTDSWSDERADLLLALAESARSGETKSAHLSLLAHLAATPCRDNPRFVN